MDKTVNEIIEQYKDNEEIKNLGAEIMKAMPKKQRKEILNSLPADQREKLEEYLKDE